MTLVGRTLAHYEIVELLGAGGMGEVYRARDTKLDRDVALKVLPADMAADPERRRRFEREARTVAALRHPNIVTIHSVEEVDGRSFLTMEMVKGRTLSRIIPDEGFDAEEFLRIAVPLAEAITAAHTEGITHRDLKPANVMVDEGGQLKVLDFGLAKLREPEDPHAEKTVAVEEQTREGKILGTVAYMSPEQAEGKVVDARSDVFSLGVVLYELATGDRPFRGDTDISTISAILRDDPPSVAERKRRLPRHLGRIVRRCLAKDPDRRYQTAHDLRNDLMALREEIDSGELSTAELTPGATARPPRPPWVIPVAIVGLAAAVVAAFFGLRPLFERGRTAPGHPPPAMEMVRLTTTGNAYAAAISPDGRYVAYVRREGGQQSLLMTQVATGSAVEIVPPTENHLYDTVFSPDGDHVYYVSQSPDREGGSLYTVPVLGGTPRRLVESMANGVTFSPDGSRMVFMRWNYTNSRLVIADADGSNERILATRDFPVMFDRKPIWSPDGSVIVAGVLSMGGAYETHLEEIQVEDGSARTLTQEPFSVLGSLTWLPDQSGLIASGVVAAQEQGNQLWEIAYPSGERRRITNDTNSYASLSATADGSAFSVAVVTLDFDVHVASLEEPGGLRPVTASNRLFNGLGVAWISDERLAFSGRPFSGTDNMMCLHTVDVDGRNLRPLEDRWSGWPNTQPGHPDLVYVVSDDEGIHVWKCPVDGGEPVRLTFGEFETMPALSPDGEWLVYTGGVDWTMYRMPAGGGEPERLTDTGGHSATFSPDGSQVAFWAVDPQGRSFRVHIVSFAGGELLAEFALAYGEIAFSPDGESLSHVSMEDGFSNVWNQPLDGGPPRQVTFFDRPGTIEYFAWAPDGKRLAVTWGRRTSDVVLIRNFR